MSQKSPYLLPAHANPNPKAVLVMAAAAAGSAELGRALPRTVPAVRAVVPARLCLFAASSSASPRSARRWTSTSRRLPEQGRIGLKYEELLDAGGAGCGKIVFPISETPLRP